MSQITELTLRLYAVPEGMSAAVCAFPSVTAAVDSVIEAIQCGIPIARVELLETGVINGDLKAAVLTVAAGSRMRGQADFGWGDQGPTTRK